MNLVTNGSTWLGPAGMSAFVGLGAVLMVMTLVWVVSLVRRDVSIIDIFWGLGFVLLSWLYLFQGPGLSEAGPRQILVPSLVTLWGTRLALFIGWRNLGHGEDYRYAAMRKRIGPRFSWLSLVIVFWLQAILCWLIAMPLLQVQRGSLATTPTSLGVLDIVGLSLFAIGLFFESVGDWQMARFKSDPSNRGKVLDRGLWRYTRHPNYFGDATVWWGLSCFALATADSMWILFSPVLMTFLLLRVSGVALLEKGLNKTKPQYAEYVRRTSSFLPRAPRQG